MEIARRQFRIKKQRCPRSVPWANADTVYEGELLSMITRTVRLYEPLGPAHWDVSYDWLIPMRT
jgi:hypothetical protein